MRRPKSDGGLFLLKCVLFLGIFITISLSFVIFGRLLRMQSLKDAKFIRDHVALNVESVDNCNKIQSEQELLLIKCNEKFVISSYPKERTIDSMINDQFCDCADGSDESRTAACSSILVGIEAFECHDGNIFADKQLLRGNHILEVDAIIKTITFSRVNDGVCDCADCSDEI